MAVCTRNACALGRGPEWQAVQDSFSRWMVGSPRCNGLGAPNRPPTTGAASCFSSPMWQPRQESVATLTPVGMLAHLRKPRTVSCSMSVAVAIGTTHAGPQMHIFVVRPFGRLARAGHARRMAVVAGVVGRLSHHIEEDLLVGAQPQRAVLGLRQTRARVGRFARRLLRGGAGLVPACFPGLPGCGLRPVVALPRCPRPAGAGFSAVGLPAGGRRLRQPDQNRPGSFDTSPSMSAMPSAAAGAQAKFCLVI